MEISIWWLLLALFIGSCVGLLTAVLLMSAGKVSRELEQEAKHIDTHA